jgi:UDPglucose 6-dehydrogenase
MKVVEVVILSGKPEFSVYRSPDKIRLTGYPKHFHIVLRTLLRETSHGPDCMKITIVGGGYVGLVTGACFADIGHDVTIIDVDSAKVAMINEKRTPIFEPGLEKILYQTIGKNLQASISYDSVSTSDLTFICVGTPPNDDGSANLSYIESASRSIGTALQKSTGFYVIVVKSTVPPGTTETVVRPAVLASAHKTEDDIGFAINPEFLREGDAIEDFRQPDRIVIGSHHPRAGDRVAEVYRDFSAPVVRTGLAAAEMIKYTSNAFLATKISFANEIGNICKELGIDVYEVMKGVGLDRRIGPLFLNAGAGFGGSCFPKDVSSLSVLAGRADIDPKILRAVLEVNEEQPHRLVALLEKKAGNLSGKRIAVLGLAFKDNTDDVRDSRAIPVIRDLQKKGARVVAFDPMAGPNMQKIFPAIEYAGSAREALKGADGCLVMTEWPEFGRIDKEFDLMTHKIVIEGRRILSWKGAEGICW